MILTNERKCPTPLVYKKIETALYCNYAEDYKDKEWTHNLNYLAKEKKHILACIAYSGLICKIDKNPPNLFGKSLDTHIGIWTPKKLEQSEAWNLFYTKSDSIKNFYKNYLQEKEIRLPEDSRIYLGCEEEYGIELER